MEECREQILMEWLNQKWEPTSFRPGNLVTLNPYGHAEIFERFPSETRRVCLAAKGTRPNRRARLSDNMMMVNKFELFVILLSFQAGLDCTPVELPGYVRAYRIHKPQ